jgi:hypothetical protein
MTASHQNSDFIRIQIFSKYIIKPSVLAGSRLIIFSFYFTIFPDTAQFWWELRWEWVGKNEIKDKVFKRKTGKSKDRWIVRIEYLDELIGKTSTLNAMLIRKPMQLI